MDIIEVPGPQARWTKAVPVAELAEHTLPATSADVRATIVVQIGEADRGVELRALVELVGITEDFFPAALVAKAGSCAERAVDAGAPASADISHSIAIQIEPVLRGGGPGQRAGHAIVVLIRESLLDRVGIAVGADELGLLVVAEIADPTRAAVVPAERGADHGRETGLGVGDNLDQLVRRDRLLILERGAVSTVHGTLPGRQIRQDAVVHVPGS